MTRSAVARALGQHLVPRVAEAYHAPWAEIMVALISPCIEEVRYLIRVPAAVAPVNRLRISWADASEGRRLALPSPCVSALAMRHTRKVVDNCA